MKRVIPILLAALMLLVLASCGGHTAPEPTDPGQPSETETDAETETNAGAGVPEA